MKLPKLAIAFYLAAVAVFIATVLSSCETVAPDAFDQAEAQIFNTAFNTNVVAQPTKKLMFMP